MKIRETLKGKVKDKQGKAQRKFILRNKISRRGKEAREVLDIDIIGDRKLHRVEELDDKGNWKVVHHEDEPLKKKRKRRIITPNYNLNTMLPFYSSIFSNS